MNKTMFLMLVALLITGILGAVTPPEKKDFLGEWKFESPYAPEGYQKGIFIIKEKENALAGELKFSDAYKLDIKDMVITDGVLKFGINVDGSYVNVKATIEEGKLKGSAASPEGDLPFEATKVEKTD
jgi:hypothetical protein